MFETLKTMFRTYNEWAMLPIPRQNVTFLLIDKFSVMGLSGPMEVYRHANRFGPKAVYNTMIASVDGGYVTASNGLQIRADLSLDTLEHTDVFVIVAGVGAEKITDRKLLAVLQRLRAQRCILGGVSTGGLILARAGLLNGYRATVHWESFASLVELYPKVTPVFQHYVRDRDRITCSGGTSTIDLFLDLVSDDLDSTVVTRITEQMQMDRQRSGEDKQGHRLNRHGKPLSTAVARAVAQIEFSIDEPTRVNELARLAGVTSRHLLRLFRQELGTTPVQFGLDIRLQRAHSLILNTSMALSDIAAATGFNSRSHMTQRYRNRYAETPTQTRLN